MFGGGWILSFVRSRYAHSLCCFAHIIRHERNGTQKCIHIYCVANLRKGLVHRSHWFEQFVRYTDKRTQVFNDIWLTNVC